MLKVLVKIKVKNYRKYLYGLVMLGAVFITVPLAYAQTASPELVEQATGKGFVPCGNPGQATCSVYHIFNGVIAILNFFIAFAGLYAVFVIIVAGVKMVFSAGNTTKFTAARKQVTNAVFGFAIVLCSFLAINTLLSGGNVGVGLRNGAKVLTNPLEFIKGE